MSCRIPQASLLATFAVLATAGLSWSAAPLPSTPQSADEEAARHAHEQEVMESKFCAGCHPVMYAEHEQNTHGRAFTDEEVRLATGRFALGTCIDCHTPRPVFETGIGMNPQRRYHGLEEGNTCMTCHWQPDYDYGTFQGGQECKSAFDPRVGTVDACAACHRNHGTPYQWERAPLGKAKGRECISCHMQKVVRPVALGEEARPVASHVFPGSRSEKQLHRAFDYTAELDGNEVVVRIRNKGVGHNMPTELKQRSLESLIVVRDTSGQEVGRSRMVFRDPYKRPYGLRLPVNTQIRSGEEVEHRVPLPVADGIIDCELHFKLYYPIADHHPDLARRLELKRLPFEGIEPSTKPIESVPHVPVVVPESIDPETASPANLVDFARDRLSIGEVEVDIPQGNTAEDITKLIELFQFPVPQGNRDAQDRLVEVGLPAVPQLVEGLGSWDNKTWKQSMSVLGRIGAPAVPALVEAMDSDQLYVRLHSRLALVQAQAGDAPGAADRLIGALTSKHALDRASAAEALGKLGIARAAGDVRPLLGDRDPDVVRAAAQALGRLGDREAVAAIAAAGPRFRWKETKRDLAAARAHLGDPSAVHELLAGLDHDDDLIRESFFEAVVQTTGLHEGFDPMAPRAERLEGISRLQQVWATDGGADRLRPWPREDPAAVREAEGIIKKLGDGPEEKDRERIARLIELDDRILSVLRDSMKYPSGFATKRIMLCEVIGVLRLPDLAPGLVAALRDPVFSVASWANWALAELGAKPALPPVQRYHRRLLTAIARGEVPASVGHPDALLAQSVRTRLVLGEKRAAQELVPLLLSPDLAARQIAIGALSDRFGYDLGFDPEGLEDDRRRIANEWIREVD